MLGAQRALPQVVLVRKASALIECNPLARQKGNFFVDFRPSFGRRTPFTNISTDIKVRRDDAMAWNVGREWVISQRVAN